MSTEAPGGPGMPPRWSRGAKEAVGTAYSTASRVWYTVAAGILTEIYYPTLDTPQIRDLQLLITDGLTFFHDERRDTGSTVDCIDEASLGFQIINVARNRGYTIRKTVIGHPHHDCVLMHTRLEADPEMLKRLQLFVLCAPHLEIGGWHNSGEVVDTKLGRILVAFKGSTWMALGTSSSFGRCSCGYVAVNDGWTDLHDNFALDWQYDRVSDGNIALTGEVVLSRGTEFTVGLAFGDTRHRAITNLFQSLVGPFPELLDRFANQWSRTSKRFALAVSNPDRAVSLLYERSVNLLLAHEDKAYPGALIAGLTIPWGSSRGDEDPGGYHLVWTRDLVQSATALLAAGDTVTPLRALVYLAVTQRADGGFDQNFWLDGRAYRVGVQLDETSFPVVLAWRLHQAGALGEFDPRAMVRGACGYLIREGPWTAQERWEEAAGYSPSTLAIHIAALVCAAELIEGDGDTATANFVREYADFLDAHIEPWTVTTRGSLVSGVTRHYIRINPNVMGDENPDTASLVLANQPPGGPYEYPARDIVDAGFLELVRYGIRDGADPLVVDSLRVVDTVLKVETPVGPCWRRYNHDGYGQRADGSAYREWGVGRPWPLLTGERGHYELAAGREAWPYVKALEKFAVGAGLLPEQIWDQDPVRTKLLRFGGPTGAAMPLAWAHAEYIKLVRSIHDGRVFDRLSPVEARYAKRRRERPGGVEIWSDKRPVETLRADRTLRVISGRPFALEWTVNDWKDRQLASAVSTGIDVWYVDLHPPIPSGSVRFRFRNDSSDEGPERIVRIADLSPT